MSLLDDTQISCGIDQLWDLCSDPEVTLETGFDYVEPLDLPAMIIFSDTVSSGRGAKLAEYIVAQGLGSVLASKICLNPNSGNRIRMWIWHVNRAKTKKWIKAHVTQV